ncbi:MAG: AMP-binding protein, partial [Actinobacteria bacterium]|nr:AMP-binding protein [Actinomycetota bacterium]
MSKPLQHVDPQRIWSRICDLAIEDAERPSIAFVDGAEYSRAAVVTLAEAVAAGIQRGGVRPGDRVVTMLDNGIEIIATWLACLRIGAVLVPLNTSMRGPILTHMLATSEPSLSISASEYATQVDAALPAGHRCLQVIVGDPLELATSAAADWASLLGPGEVKGRMARPEEPAAILFTSGTTGPSKGVVWSELTEVGLARGADLVAGFVEDDVSYVTLPLFHANGLFISLLPALFVGARSVIDDRFSVSNFWPRIAAHDVTVTSLLGIMAPLLLQREAAELDRAHSLRRAFVVP